MDSCSSIQERADGIRLFQQHAASFGCHPASGLDLLKTLTPSLGRYGLRIEELPPELSKEVAAFTEWLRLRRDR